MQTRSDSSARNQQAAPVAGTDAPEGGGNGCRPKQRGWLAPTVLLTTLALIGGGLVAWKAGAIQRANSSGANQPEPVESVTVATAESKHHRRTTTSIGTVVALRSVSLRNELAGTVNQVSLTPGQIVEEGALLVALDVSVEEAELKAQEAEARLAQTLLTRLEKAVQSRAASQIDMDRAQAQLDVAQAQMTRTKAIIARKTIRAPFRARIGISDVHRGQYLNEGTLLTTLQGVDAAAFVDFAIPQQVAEDLKPGERVEILTGRDQPVISAEIVAVDSRVNSTTRSTTVRARVDDAEKVPAPGASVRVRTPASAEIAAISVPVSALRKGPSGDHVYVITQDESGKSRAKMRSVRAGTVIGDQVLLLSGVSAGEKVAAHGSFKLRDNALVVVSESNTLAAK